MAYVDTEARPTGEVQQKVGRIRLSEAIRIGARIRPQCVWLWFDNGKSCAQGAAYEAVFGYPGDMALRGTSTDPSRPGTWIANALRDKFPEYGPIAGEIQSRNDRGESRESIADWLQSMGL
jgi:hypothetical protein